MKNKKKNLKKSKNLIDLKYLLKLLKTRNLVTKVIKSEKF